MSVEVLDEAVAVRVIGEIDLATGPHLSRALAEALRRATPAIPLVVDCSRLTFCDSAGLNALLIARQTAQKAGIDIRLDSPNHQMRRLLDITGTLPLFPLHAPPSNETPM
ncbi:STAS domain-containing protein [Streptomyces sp. DK15]|uniref:STAS domain-containing protein n=1 Tax=Streptomyces sp. DK15 TaxID=2957499 RepID=UPI0029AE9582|nr:STAS domain-containing protein [Streptomyces sp. DK15]MDX2389400.1 STAS domain-containing protein [Streptomyces sp. DK15]